jgi:hypothetical protein
MADALKPGGWLILEDPDIGDIVCDASTDEPNRAKVETFFDAFRASLAGIGWDMRFGTNTLKCLKDNGLDMLSSEGRSFAFFGGSPYAEHYQLTTEQLRERILATGLITNEGIDDFMELTEQPSTGFRSMKNVVTWGRKPF